MTPILSVVTPLYNAERYIETAVKSILNQTFTDYEYIIIDDCSTDGSYDIVERLSKDDSRIKLFKNSQNLNIAGNRNKGVELARGKYILWQDADDISYPVRAEKLVTFMEGNPEVGICGSYLQSFTDTADLDIRKYSVDDAVLRKNIFKFSPVAQPSAIVRKICFDELGKFNTDYPPAEDIEMSFRIGTKYHFANIPEVLLRYREHPNSATYSRMKKMLRSTLSARKNFMHNPAYSFGISDYIAYFSTYCMSYLPPNFVVSLFKIAREVVSFTQIK